MKKIYFMKKRNIPVNYLICIVSILSYFFITNNLISVSYASSQILLVEENENNYMNKSRKALKQGDYEEAIKFATLTIELNPTNEKAYYYRGLALTISGKQFLAIKDLSKAIEINPIADYFLIRGEAFYKTNKKLEALSDFNKVIETETNKKLLAITYNYIGIIKSSFGDHENAIISFSRGLEIDPKDFKAYNNRAKSRMAIENYVGAINDMKMMIKINEKSDIPYYGLGIVYGQHLKQYSKAIFYTEKAIKINPNSTDALHNLGYLYQLKGDIKKACSNYQKSYNLGSTKSLTFMKRLGCK